MKFSTRKDTELTADQLFQSLVDFDRLERILARRGAAVTRLHPAQQPAAGAGWQVGFDWRGRRRELRLEVMQLEAPGRMVISGLSEAFDLIIDLTVMALSKQRSRVIFEAEALPRNMRARLMLQTAKLGKSQLDRKFDTGVARLVNELTAGRA
ncbi:hypothetical protein [uncultured Paracoccus sp.]|uniref:hypothetical protein n=1 Tax=uncultured Paracoccus sp. TaxID=189685 RepID=UPI002626C437|nr:hypothetical protein [uncultured Paracoccus sp.]